MDRIVKIAVVGQLVDIWERWQNNPNAKTQFQGLTVHKLSEVTKIPVSTMRRYIIELEQKGYLERDILPYRNETKTVYFPTNLAVSHWNMYKNTSSGKEARALVAKRWMDWYSKRIKEVYKSCGATPFFRV